MKYDVEDLTRLVRTKVTVCEECGCWRWDGSLDTSGYAKFKLRGKTIQVHRYSFESLTGKTIPEGLTIDHLNCTTRRCINPEHFELVTLDENARRANDTRWHDMKRDEFGNAVGRIKCATCLESEPPDGRTNNGAGLPSNTEEWHD